MTTILKTSEAHDFLALVPQLVGMHPRESIVIVVFQGNRTCGAMRFDLPPAGERSGFYREVATTIIGMVCRLPGVDAVVPVVFTDAPCGDSGEPPHRVYADVLVRRAVYSGFVVRDALWVAADGWGHYRGYGRSGTHALSLIEGSEAFRSLPPEARRVLVDIDAESSLPPTTPARCDRVMALGLRLEEARADAPTLIRELAAMGFGNDIVTYADTLARVDDAQPTEEDAALLGFLASDPQLRDVLLVTWAWGAEAGDNAAETNFLVNAGEPVDDRPTIGALGGWGMPRPQPERIRRAIGIMRSTASVVPVNAQAPVMTMLAWLHWSLGHGSIAGRWIDQARAVDADYSFAELLGTMLSVGHLPEWAFEEAPVHRG